MFLADYYYGPTRLHQFLKLFTGPALIFVGHRLFISYEDSVMVAYGGFCILLGIYLILKPLIWVLRKWEKYHEVEIEVELTNTSIKLIEKNKDLRLNFCDLKKVLVRKIHYSIVLNDDRKLYLPLDSLTKDEQLIIIEKNISN